MGAGFREDTEANENQTIEIFAAKA